MGAFVCGGLGEPVRAACLVLLDGAAAQQGAKEHHDQHEDEDYDGDGRRSDASAPRPGGDRAAACGGIVGGA